MFNILRKILVKVFSESCHGTSSLTQIVADVSVCTSLCHQVFEKGHPSTAGQLVVDSLQLNSQHHCKDCLGFSSCSLAMPSVNTCTSSRSTNQMVARMKHDDKQSSNLQNMQKTKAKDKICSENADWVSLEVQTNENYRACDKIIKVKWHARQNVQPSWPLYH